ncbi:MAG: tetratricopeptide repeat protein [Luteolibacter sp.]
MEDDAFRMAKRKKKSGGGAFGSGRKAGPSAPAPKPQTVMSVRDSERMTKIIHKIVAAKEFGSIEEMQAFVGDHLVGLELEELEAMLPDDALESDFERAESLIAGIPEGTSADEVIRIARQALALSEYCMGAWFEYGVYADDTATALERFEKGIERGRARFEEQIKESGEGHGLWGYVEARDFMRLLEERAKALVELGRMEEAAEVYEEMLALSPNDNQGIRCDLLRILLIHRRLEDARKLLDRFPNDALADMAYGRALLEIVETADRTGFEIPDANSPKAPASPAAFRKALGPEFQVAIGLLNHAVKVNPFVPLFMTHGSILDVEVDELACFGGPYEAVTYAQQWCLLWYASGLPFLLLSGVPLENVKKLAKSPHITGELLDVSDQLEDFDALEGQPWWEKFDERM